ncbi:MAG TPA: adenylate/guanylate cyclase domain-containing protein [Stellaceae bacterium]|nr:adenylate/guanylate cyclase domain-containing protein [Stellaceae bacterium]
MEAPQLERRLAAIVAADVEGYSRLMHGDEEGTMAALSARRAVLDELVAGHRGRIANTAGDSVLAEFASVLDAVVCALEIQRALARLDEADAERTMRFRIGINVGDVMVKDGDLFGDGVNVAARLESLAEGGGICVSRGVRDHLRHRMNLVFEDLGEQLVKNIAHPIRAFRLRLGDDSPAALLSPALPDGTEPQSGLISTDHEVALELAFWESVKDGGPAELATYLERFPEGTFADLARTRQSGTDGSMVDAVSGEREGGPDAAELSFWDSVKDSQRIEEITAYLDQYPDGHFAVLARARLSYASEAEDEALSSVGDAVELAFWEAIAESHNAKLFEAYLQKYPDGEFAVIAKARLESEDVQ